MKVAELIAALSKMDPNMVVAYPQTNQWGHDYHESIDQVEVVSIVVEGRMVPVVGIS